LLLLLVLVVVVLLLLLLLLLMLLLSHSPSDTRSTLAEPIATSGSDLVSISRPAE
jgi:hypothetical protein